MSRLLHTWVSEHAARRPDATAVVMHADRLSYGELDRRSTRVARLLRDAGCHPGDRVALFVPKSPDAIVALLAVLKAGGTYVPIDLRSPAARVAKMLVAVEPAVVLAAPVARPLLDELDASLGSVPLGWLTSDPPPRAAFSRVDEARMSDVALDASSGAGDPAYILFTSGSTGVPKGVVVTQRSVAAFVDWGVRYFGLGPDDRVSGHSPLHFDLSVFDMFGAFAAGAELHLVPDELRLLAAQLAEWIRTSALTQWFSVPSVLAYLAQFDAVRAGDFPALRRVLWCGDVLPTPVLIHWMTRLPHARFTNLYGPTEATIASSYYTVPRCPESERASVPIGVGCDGEELLVLDEHLRPVQPGVIGDLYIRGVGLSPGYWKDDERTERAFVYPPGRHDAGSRMYRTGDLARIGDDGLVDFVGRADSQVKSRGHRIELGEIETALHASSDLADCAVVAISTGGFEGATICCAYVAARDAAPTPASLRRFLAARVPPYMFPSRWLALDRLPTNANGKVDRSALRERFQAASDSHGTPHEEKTC